MSYPEKYLTLLDSEIWQFIRDTERWYPPDAVGLSVDQQREVYDKMCAAFRSPRPEAVTVQDGTIETPTHAIPIRRYEVPTSNPSAEVVYYHGGGFVVGSLDSHDDVCAEICESTGYPVTSIDYRLAPEHTFPSDFEDALAGYNHVAQLSELPVVVCGDSAGGNLAAAVSHSVRGQDKPPVGQVLIYPGLGKDYSRGSFLDHSEAPMLTTADLGFYKTIRTGGDETLAHSKECAPLNDKDFSNLPPTIVLGAECDPLCDDGQSYCNVINATGGQAHFIKEAGLVHGHLRARHRSEKAGKSFARICRSISLLGAGEWPANPEVLDG